MRFREAGHIDAGMLFGEYELLARSGFFDADYYLKAYPDIARLNVDPLLHYLERGCHERREPSAQFDTAHYLKLCAALGETPANALTHYLTVGVKRGLAPRAGAERQASAGGPPSGALSIDIPRIINGVAEPPGHGGLSIVGWAVAGGEVAIDVAVDGVRVAGARHGLRRPDVAAAHPVWAGALQSGFAVHLPPKALSVGRRQVSIALRSGNDGIAQIDFLLDVPDAPADRGPSALRRRMSLAEVDLKLDSLTALDWQPQFLTVMPVGSGREEIDAARRTLASLSRQTYPDWRLQVTRAVAQRTGRARAERAPAVFAADLARGFEDFAPQLHVAEAGGSTAFDGAEAGGRPCFILKLAPGDELGCDALLEFALASGTERDAEFFYCDDRRLDPSGREDAYFKPAWSPDLLLATSYVGRAWCAERRLLERAGFTLAHLVERGDYDVALRLTESSRRIVHLPKLLHQQGSHRGGSGTQERKALVDAVERRKLGAEVRDGVIPGTYRVKRQTTSSRVSIIIPTCAAGGYIERCLETLKSVTAHRDYEIRCIQNIPKSGRSWKPWLKQHADVVMETREPFNWSRFNNLAAARATGSFLLFLNDDTEIIDPEWLDALVEQAQRREVGVVGPLLLYPDLSVQEAGVMLDHAGRGLHAFRHLSDGEPGYFGLARTQRNVLSVTGACLMTRRATFDALGGFDISHSVINNDLDYCLRAWDSGLLNIYTPHARLIHHELGSRAEVDEQYDAEKFRRRWGALIAKGDPYFNPHLARDQEILAVEREPLEALYAGRPLVARDSVRRILVVKLDHIGDCLTALPALRRLKGHFPGARISVLAGRATHAIWKAEAAVDEVIEFNFFHARSGLGKLTVTDDDRRALAETLTMRRFDLAIDLRKQPDAREILRASGARVLAGFDSQGRFPWLDVALEWDEDVPLRTKHTHVGDDLVALVDAVSRQCERDACALLETPVGGLSLPHSEQRRLFAKPVVCVHPASGSPMRQWPLEKYAALIELLMDLDHHVALIGGPDEVVYVHELTALLPRRKQVFDLAGRLKLDELPKVLARAVLFVGNNSGPQHWAAALGIPTIGIHSGVVDAREWGPAGPKALALRRVMSCSPCFLEYPEDCPRGIACLTELAVADVHRACLQALLARPHAKAASLHTMQPTVRA